MGWTSTDARFYTADGKVNRKAECDALYAWEGEKTKNEVIKSSMRGSVYYAAVRTTDKTTGHSEVFAAVCLTSTRRDGGFNFGYKGMAEDMGPCEDDCPKGILVLLTDTESKYAKEWRERCWAKIRDKKQNRQSLASIKIGEIIEFERGGVTIRAEKMAPAYQFKTPWFKVVGEFEYVHKTEIKDWRIVADNAATPSETPQISTEATETVNVSAEGEKAAERTEIEVQTIADMVAIGESLNKGESVSFKLHLHFLWSVTITNESAEWCEEFKYSLNAKCLDNPQSFGRRYTSFGLAMLHCLNRFNENANIRDDYETLSAALNKPQNLISDFRAPQSPEAPQMTECIDEPCKLAQTA